MARATAVPLRPDANPWLTEARATLALAWPLILTNMAQMLINATDVVMMGWLGPEALAAGALANNLNIIFLIFGIGIVTACSPLVAAERGRARHAVRDIRRTVRQTLWVAATISPVVMLIMWQAESILLAFNQQPHVAALAAEYADFIALQLPLAFFYTTFRLFLTALERPVVPMIIGAIAVPVNAVFNYALMFGHFGAPELGLKGAAVGSVATSAIMLACIVATLLIDRRLRRYHVFGRFWKPDWPRYRHIFRLGLPIAVMLTLEIAVFSIGAFLMGMISVTALAAHQIALQIAGLTFMVPLSFGQASTVRVGRAFGARDLAGIARAGWTPYVMGVAFMAAMGVVIITFSTSLVGVFLDLGNPDNRATIAVAVQLLSVAALFQVVDGAQVIAAGMLRGLQDTRVPMIIAGVGYWVVGLGTALLLAFVFDLGGVGVWLGLSAGLAAVALALIWRWLTRGRLNLTPDFT